MAILKTQGVVIRDQDLGETSKIITLYTPDFGKGMEESPRAVNYFHYFRIQFLRTAGFQPQLERIIPSPPARNRSPVNLLCKIPF